MTDCSVVKQTVGGLVQNGFLSCILHFDGEEIYYARIREDNQKFWNSLLLNDADALIYQDIVFRYLSAKKINTIGELVKLYELAGIVFYGIIDVSLYGGKSMDINYDIIKQYLNSCKHQKGLSQKTIKAYKIDLDQFYRYIYAENKAMDKNGITSYITHISSSYKPKSIKRKIASLKAFFSYLEYEEIIDQTPFHKIKTHYKDPFILPRTIPLSSATAIFKYAYFQLHKAECDNLSLRQYLSLIRNAAVLELLFSTGIRVSELCSLKDEDVNLTENYIKVYGKGSKERVIQIGNENVITTLRKYVLCRNKIWTSFNFFFVNRSGNKLSDQSVRFMIKNYAKAANITLHITPHMFRHTFATLLLEENVDIRYIQQLLGHSSIVTTQIYTHVTSNKQKNILTENNPRNHIDLITYVRKQIIHIFLQGLVVCQEILSENIALNRIYALVIGLSSVIWGHIHLREKTTLTELISLQLRFLARTRVFVL